MNYSDWSKELEQKIEELHDVLEQMYPEQIQELARLLGWSEEEVQYSIDSTQKLAIGEPSKYLLVSYLLTFHRVKQKSDSDRKEM